LNEGIVRMNRVAGTHVETPARIWQVPVLASLAALAWLAFVLPATPALAAEAGSGQRTFDSPQEAIEALVAAVRADDAAARMLGILGPEADPLVTSGDPVGEKRGRDRFSKSYATAHRIVMDAPDRATLVIGKRDWPYPIPIVKSGATWHFDTAAGVQEILDRRIGRDELNAIAACRAYASAQREYATVDRNGDGVLEYATRIQSTPGSRDGLYWPVAEGEAPSPIGPLMARAQAKGYWLHSSQEDVAEPYYGYYYRILTRQGDGGRGGAYDYVVDDRMIGGFALVAFPARYGASGIMTFLINQEGVVYQADLGAETDRIARSITAYDPGASWTQVREPNP